jgi:hypothetical protein
MKLGFIIKTIYFLCLFWSIAYLLSVRPSFFEDLGKSMGLSTVIIIYVGFLFSYFVFFIYPKWRKRPLSEFIFILAGISFFIFLNLFIISGHAPYGPIGIFVILIFLVLALIEEEVKRRSL